MTRRVAMISGANRGIGEAIALRLHDRGFDLSLGVRVPDTAQHLIERFGAERCLVFPYDASIPGTDTAWLAATIETFGRLDALVNNAGVYGDVAFSSIDFEAIDDLLQINAKAVLSVSRAAFDHLRKTRGRIINIVSISGIRYFEGECLGYTISKFAAMGVSKILQSHGQGQVQTTAICPGLVNTRMVASAPVPPAQMIQPAEIALVVDTVLTLPNSVVIEEIIINDAT